RARVWYLERSASVCGACANGCNMEIYHREGTIYRFQPRENDVVNQYWMCDAGRMSYRGLQGEGRLLQPLVRGAEEFAPATWQGAGAALERVPYLVVLDTDLRETAEYANVVLPIGTYAESDGTFTNHAGRVQRFRPAVKPPGGARPGWEVLGALLVALGVETRFG